LFRGFGRHRARGCGRRPEHGRRPGHDPASWVENEEQPDNVTPPW